MIGFSDSLVGLVLIIWTVGSTARFLRRNYQTEDLKGPTKYSNGKCIVLRRGFHTKSFFYDIKYYNLTFHLYIKVRNSNV